MGKLFISYSHKDSAFVHKLAVDLKKTGHEVFYDTLIEAGDSWAETLSAAIDRAQFILVILSPDYLVSAWAQKELQAALLREAENKAKVIPLLIKKCTPTGFIAQKKYADFTCSCKEGLDQLMPALSEVVNRSIDATDVGETEHGIDTNELQALSNELKEAVALFRGKPSEIKQLPPSKSPEGGERKRCFVVMPFGDEDLNVVYEDFVRPVVVGDCQFLCERADDAFGCNIIMEDILTSILNSNLVLADLTRKNANVFYEVGICHALGKPVLLLAQSIDDVPFDLRHRRVLLYEYTPRGCKRLAERLKDNLMAMLHQTEQ